jgi:hypothetical protein
MIKFIQCVRRKQGLSVAEFRRYWETYQDRLRALAEISGAVRLTVDTTLAVEQNAQIMISRGTDEPYDGLAEFWWSTGPEALAFVNRPDVRESIEATRLFQQEFMDLERSTFFFTSEEVCFVGADPGRGRE